jgi:stage IV sporulation protein FB
MPFYRITPDRDRPSGWLILEVFDIPFYVETSFLFMAALVFMYAAQGSSGPNGGGNQALVLGGLLVLIVFFSLLVHEAGHALVCRLFGLQPVTVSLVMFGGFTRHPPTTHGRSLVITLAGPTGTLIMAVLGLMLPQLMPVLRQYEASRFVFGAGGVLFQLNLFWLIFNLLPIYPMDGGQSLFHIFSFFAREPRAMLVVAYLSLLTCGAVGIYLFTHNYRGLFIYLFLAMFIQQNVQIVRHLRLP